ncbi:MAG: hypothetical protein JWM21_1998 [Acidobacteria bacterium]|nr:hypothetical protein [Acidobacteriota bacterium]
MGLAFELVEVTGQVGVEAPAQTPKRESRQGIELFPSSPQSSNGFRTYAHKSPETVLVPVGTSVGELPVESHQKGHSLGS